MKRFNILKYLIIVSVFFTSCEKNFLDVIPEDRLTDETFWKTEKDVDLALAACYRNFDTYRFNLWLDLATDNGYSQFPNDRAQVMGNGQLNAANPGLLLWDFSQIRKYNNFLEKIEAVPMNEDKKKKYKAEVRFLRAYDYVRKVQLYGDVPLLTNVIFDPAEAKMGRNPKDEVVKFILNELAEIAPMLPVMNMRTSGGHATQGSAYALKARLELFEKMYAEAMVDAKKVMDMSVYELYPNYIEQFSVDNENANKESIMEIVQIRDFYSTDAWVRLLPASVGGFSSITPVQSIVDAYETADGKTINETTSGYNPDKPYENRDPRLAMTILYPGAPFNGKFFDPLSPTSPDYHQNAAGPRPGFNLKKYAKIVPSSLLTNSDVNIIVIRLGEVLLTYAEAAIEANQITDDAYNAIDRVRQRAGIPKVDRAVYNTQTKMRELIRRERRVELAFEGLRYYDIKRWNIGNEVLNGPLYGTRLGSVNAQTGVVTYNANRIKLEDRVFNPARNYLLPIPQSELDANPNIKQNPGY